MERVPTRLRATGELRDRAREYVLEQPSRRWAAVVTASALLHAPFVFRREIGTARDEMVDIIDEKLRGLRVAGRKIVSEYARDNATMELKRELRTAFESGRVLDVDLDEVFYSTEYLAAGFSASDIEHSEWERQKIVDEALELKKSGAQPTEVLGYILKQQGAYEADQPYITAMLRDSVEQRSANCEGRYKYIVSAVEDVYPEWAEQGKIVGQLYGEYVDDQGEYHPGHIRAAVQQGTALLVLEGDAPFLESITAGTAPVYESHWLALSSYLAGEGEISYQELGIPEATQSVGRPSHPSERSFLRFPNSASRYSGGRGTESIAPRKVGDSWANSVHEELIPVQSYGEITDAELAQHVAERKERIEGPYEAERERFLSDLDVRGVRWRDAEHYKPSIIDLTKVNDTLPLNYAELQQLAGYDIEDHDSVSDRVGALRIRGDQELPPGAERVFSGGKTELVVSGNPNEMTLRTMKQFPRVDIEDLYTIPTNLREYHWSRLNLLVGGDANWSTLGEIVNIQGSVAVIRAFDREKDWSVPVSGLYDVSAEECHLQLDGDPAFRASYLGFRDCLPQGTYNIPHAEGLHILYFGPSAEVPRFVGEQRQLRDVSMNIAYGHLPSHTFSRELLNPQANVSLRVAELRDGSLSGITARTLVLASANRHFDDRMLQRAPDGGRSKQRQRPQFTLGEAVLDAATIHWVELDLTDREGWRVHPRAFLGANIDNIAILARYTDRERVERISFPEGTVVQYEWINAKRERVDAAGNVLRP